MIDSGSDSNEQPLRTSTSEELAAVLDKLFTRQTPMAVQEKFEDSPSRALSIAVTVIPLDENGKPSGAPIGAMTRHISIREIGLIHTSPPGSNSLLVEIRASRMERARLPVEVVRCRPAGKFYEIDGRFMTDGQDRPGKGMASSIATLS